ncbi:MAG TPA: iron donor protein CyaY [Polyangiaceae bacterium]|jgi:CyaY protein
MDEQSYLKLADTTFRRIEDLLDEVDADHVDIERAGDVVTLTFEDKSKCIVNTQRPTRQIWLAAGARAWHFDWDGARWVDDKDKTTELYAAIARIVKERAGVDLAL